MRSAAGRRILVCALGLAFAALAGGSGARAAARLPEASRGVVDLSRASPFPSAPLRLAGEWSFYPGRLLSPADFAATDGETEGAPGAGSASVPGCWPIPASQGFGTYRLLVQLPEGAPPLALLLPPPHSAYRLWVDGSLAAAGGAVGTRAQGEDARYQPAFLYLGGPARSAATSAPIELVLQVSNFHFRCGGLTAAPLLGPADGLLAARLRLLAADTAAFGAIAIVGLYHLVLFAFRREEKSALYCAAFALLIALRLPFLGQAFALQLWPGLSLRAGLSLEYGADYLALPVFFAFLRSIVPAEVHPWAVPAASATALGGLLSLLGPTLWASRLIQPYEALVVMAIVYALSALVLAARRGRPDATLLLVGASLFFASLVNDLLNDNLLAATGHLVPLGTVAFLLAQAAVVARRLGEAYRESRAAERLIAERDERLRRDVAEHLHGRVQTGLVAVSQAIGEAIEALPPEAAGAAGSLEGARAAIDRIREEDVRQASHRLHPAAVELGLVPAVEALARSFGERLLVTLEVAPGVVELDRDSDRGVAAPVRLAAYRILEEALNNVAIHAATRRAEVRLTLEGGALVLIVADRGRGFGRRAAGEGLGLRGMEARAHAVGGRVEVESRPGRGTRVRAWLPAEGGAAGG